MRQSLLLAAASVVALTAAGHAWAQEADDTTETRRLDQVTVTAVKREQDLNEVPVSVTAFTAAPGTRPQQLVRLRALHAKLGLLRR